MPNGSERSPAVRRGPKTTEFWLNLLAIVIGAVAGLQLGGWPGAVIAVTSAVLVALGYTQARTRTKTMGAGASAASKLAAVAGALRHDPRAAPKLPKTSLEDLRAAGAAASPDRAPPA